AGPMCELEKAARDVTTGAILDVSVFGGFPYSDTAYTGASVFVVSDASSDPDGHEADAAARTIMSRIHELAPAFHLELPSPAQALARALAIREPGLIAVTDSGDNPLSGGGGDTPELFRHMLAAQPQIPCLFASFADREVVRQASQAGVGQRIEVVLGGRHGSHFGAGVPTKAIVEKVTSGRFVNTGPMQTGVERRCGSSVLLRIEGLPCTHVIVTERVVAGDDPAFYVLHGIDLASLRLLCVKAKNHFRAAFAERCIEIIDCDAPGPACQDLSQLPFQHGHISAGY
nr:MlrC C-terminal domain-containing protein [Pseudomonas sp.]